MKKALTLGVLVLIAAATASAAIVTNINQSAIYFRLISRNASTDVDAVYYNPAGLTRMADGWHFSLSNQTLKQEKTVENGFQFLNEHTYVGETLVPVYPNFYAVYKYGPLALSFGFGPNAGGGSVDYKTGLPSFETTIATLPLALSAAGIPTTKYAADIAFEGSSVFLGFQANASYAVNEFISAAFGARYISATNTYLGHIKNILVNPVHPTLNPQGQLISAVLVFNSVGMPETAAALADKIVDVKQTGSGFTPILSLNAAPIEGLNLSLRYEFNTKLEMVNKVAQDNTGTFIDGEKFRNDIPAILALGADYFILPNLRATASFSLYFDKEANWAGREAFVDSNSYDLGVGVEYGLNEAFLVSAGYQLSKVGLAAGYQSDRAFDLSSDGFGFGGRWKISPQFDLDAGLLYVGYRTTDKKINYGTFGVSTETYKQWVLGAAFGIAYHFNF